MRTETIRGLIASVDRELLGSHVTYLAQDPLPFRKLNYTRPGQDKCSLYEADDYIGSWLCQWGYEVQREPVQVQCFRRDEAKPLAHQYSAPEPHDPWYTAHNLYARKVGLPCPDEIVLLVAHKDSQSWIDSPGALDNAVGTAGVMEVARVLSEVATRRSVWFLFCNEEHTPWTSATAAQRCRERGDNLVAIFNLDGLAGRSQEDIDGGRMVAVTAYTEEDGRPLAEQVDRVTAEYGIRLDHRVCRREFANDDDGSFVKAGYPAAVLHIGSFPYVDPNYHTPGDTADRVNLDNLRLSVQAIVATVGELTL